MSENDLGEFGRVLYDSFLQLQGVGDALSEFIDAGGWLHRLGLAEPSSLARDAYQLTDAGRRVFAELDARFHRPEG